MKVYFERRGEVAVLQIDNPPVNGLNLRCGAASFAGLQRARNDPAKVSGDHRHGTRSSPAAPTFASSTPGPGRRASLLQVLDAVEGSPKPVIAGSMASAWRWAGNVARLPYRIATRRSLASRGEDRLRRAPAARSGCRAR